MHRLLLHPGVWLAARCNYLPPSHCTDRIARPAPTICVLQARARWARRPRLQLLLPLPSPATTASLWRPWISLLAAVACPRACTRLVSCVLGCRWVGVGGGWGGLQWRWVGKGPDRSAWPPATGRAILQHSLTHPASSLCFVRSALTSAASPRIYLQVPRWPSGALSTRSPPPLPSRSTTPRLVEARLALLRLLGAAALL